MVSLLLGDFHFALFFFFFSFWFSVHIVRAVFSVTLSHENVAGSFTNKVVLSTTFHTQFIHDRLLKLKSTPLYFFK